MSSYHVNKLKIGIKYDTEVTLNRSLNMIGDSNDETNLIHKLSLTDKRVLKLC